MPVPSSRLAVSSVLCSLPMSCSLEEVADLGEGEGASESEGEGEGEGAEGGRVERGARSSGEGRGGEGPRRRGRGEGRQGEDQAAPVLESSVEG